MAIALVSTKDLDRHLWLQYRKEGIGGSDVSGILGMNKHKSPFSVYMDKIGEAQDEDQMSEAAYFGNVFEEAVAQEFSKRTGLAVRRRNAILQHEEYPFMLANVDRLIVGQKVGLECKTASEYLKDEWTGEDVPISYLLQCQHYMAVTDYEAWWIAVLIGGNKFVYKRIERDDDIINHLIQAESSFWNNHVIPKVPPLLDGSEASTNFLKQLYPEARPDTQTDLPYEAVQLLEQLELAKKDEKEIKERVIELENRLKEMLGNYEIGRVKNYMVIWKNVFSDRPDTKALAADHPELYEKYLKTSVYRRFSIKKAN
ncbi:hypothetical protein J5TS2_40890 [Brevibacillus halotolerans]|uniref:YqaJ viral recombinase family nuclease n=1 Tax=Brevibacillus halotolerans TaxID=1507437 RepID=UPI001B199F0C|nr:YqaJ viral recombinase family protein [Brevibacillus halotolerans]GIO03421.1 hypothetical protein J5TS2_40890 [Brevibacillus halotolerans]